jgi:Transglutaminase-like superfamily
MKVASKRPYYLRTITYDVYTGHGWSRSNGPKRGVAPGDRIFPGYTPERPLSADAFALETVTVEIQQNLGNNIFTPGFPTAAFLPVVVQQPDGQPFLGGLESGVGLGAGKGYQITAAISNATEAMLAGAGTDYPPEVNALYLDTTGVTDRTKERARALVAGIGDPYHQAKALAAYLQGPSFHYSTIAPLPADPSRDLVDFFLFDPKGQIGYCEYFATAMAVMARSVGLPARVAVGYAPGERMSTGVYQYRERNAHAWAEIYFPGYGWQIFEATKSLPPVIRLTGSGVVPPVIPPIGGGGTSPFHEGADPGVVSDLPSFEPVSGGFRPGENPPVDQSRSGNLLLLTGVLGLLAVVLGWRLVRLRRRFRFMAPGDRQWQRLALAGDRAGAARNPSETIYEYAGWLEEQLPAQRGEIRQIADGKVWQSYSGRSISAEAIARLERAWARLQLPLVWLTVKRRLASFLPGRSRACSNARWVALAAANGSAGRPISTRTSPITRTASTISSIPTSPMWPKRRILPAHLPCPPATIRPRARMAALNGAHSSPSGSHAAVTVAERMAGAATSTMPSASRPAWAPAATAAWRAQVRVGPSATSRATPTRRPNSTLTAGVHGVCPFSPHCRASAKSQ